MRRYVVTCRVLAFAALAVLLHDPRCQAAPIAIPTSPSSTAIGPGAQISDRIEQLCPLVEAAASANTLPLDFFVRLIWKESHFRPHIMGPVTRHGQRAEGIAQFMPATAAEHKLAEPFNPSAALPKSGEFLAQLREQFGNLGLAAAAYNAGPQRVRDYLSGSKRIPAETRDYVLAITGHSIDEWSRAAHAGTAAAPQTDATTEAAQSLQPAPTCRELIAEINQAIGHLPLGSAADASFDRPIASAAATTRTSSTGAEPRPSKFALEQETATVVALQAKTDSFTLEKKTSSIAEAPKRHVPSWCNGLHHPDVGVCGGVHMSERTLKTVNLPANSEPRRVTSHVHLPAISLR